MRAPLFFLSPLNLSLNVLLLVVALAVPVLLPLYVAYIAVAWKISRKHDARLRRQDSGVRIEWTPNGPVVR